MRLVDADKVLEIAWLLRAHLKDHDDGIVGVDANQRAEREAIARLDVIINELTGDA